MNNVNLEQNILLSICIPTWNRYSLLKDLLSNLSKQLENTDNVEICISDNASIDQTRDLSNESQFNFKYLSINHNNENIGFDRNVIYVSKMAKGKYVWLLSDDEVLCKDCIKNILNLIEHYEPSVIALNFLRITIYGEMVPFFAIKETLIIDKLTPKLNPLTYLSKITSIVVKRDNIDYLKLEEFIGSEFIHSALAITCLVRQCKMIVTSEPFTEELKTLYVIRFSPKKLLLKMIKFGGKLAKYTPFDENTYTKDSVQLLGIYYGCKQGNFIAPDRFHVWDLLPLISRIRFKIFSPLILRRIVSILLPKFLIQIIDNLRNLKLPTEKHNRLKKHKQFIKHWKIDE
ncbi:MAG: glycosyltransferase family 2 protein [Elusimicrobia bacterium]|nr:glycosyltransferase family 2 protein [Elusimicrobiota bacterium]